MQVIEETNGWAPRDSCDALEVDVLTSSPGEEILPRGMCEVKVAELLRLSPVSCGRDLLKEVYDAFEESGRRRQIAG